MKVLRGNCQPANRDPGIQSCQQAQRLENIPMQSRTRLIQQVQQLGRGQHPETLCR